MKFFVPNKDNGWDTYVEFVEWDDVVSDMSYNAVESARLLLWAGNIRLHCNCPSYLFWGYKYILTTMDAAIEEEDRYPTIKNPRLLGIACKHLRITLATLPFRLGNIASEISRERKARGLDKPTLPQEQPE